MIRTRFVPHYKEKQSEKPFDWGKPLLGDSDDENKEEEKITFEVVPVKKSTVGGLNIPPPVTSTSVDKESNDKNLKDVEDEDKLPVLELAAPVYLEQDPAEVNVPFGNLDQNLVSPPQEVIEDYVDEKGDQVKRVSKKVTTTETITRVVERETPRQQFTVDIPVEPGEEIEEYTDEHGQRVRRIVRTSVTTTAHAMVQGGCVDVVLKAGEPVELKHGEALEDTERIETFTTNDGHRAQKLTKRVETTEKGSVELNVEPMASQTHVIRQVMPQEIVSTELMAFVGKREKDLAQSDWDIPPTEENKGDRQNGIFMTSLEINLKSSHASRTCDPDRRNVTEAVSRVHMAKSPPVISLNLDDNEDDKSTPTEFSSGLPAVPAITTHDDVSSKDEGVSPSEVGVFRPTLHVELRNEGIANRKPSEDSVKYVSTTDGEEEEIKEPYVERSVTDAKEGVKVYSESDVHVGTTVKPTLTSRTVTKTVQQTGKSEDTELPEETVGPMVLESASPVCLDTEHSDAVIPTVYQRQVILPEWMTTVNLEPSSDVITCEVISEMPSKPEVTQTLDRDSVKEVVTQAVQKQAVLLPYVPTTEDDSEDRQAGRIRDEGPSADSAKYVSTTDREEQEIKKPEREGSVADAEEDVEVYSESDFHVGRTVKRTYTSSTVIKTVQQAGKSEELQLPEETVGPMVLESASPVCLNTEHSDAVIPTVHQRQVILPEWMTTVDLEPSSDVITWEVKSEMPSKPEITQTLDRDVVKEVVTQAVQKRAVLLPYVPATEDDSEDRQPGIIRDEVPSEDSAKYVSTTDKEEQEIKKPELEGSVADAEEGEVYSESDVPVGRTVKRTYTSSTVIKTVQQAGKNEELQLPEETVGPMVLESASPVCLDTEHSDAVIPTVHQRQVILPEWMTTVDLEPSSDVTTLEITSEMPSKPEITQTLDRDVVKEVVTQAVQKRAVLLPYVPATEDDSEDRQPGIIRDEVPSEDSAKYVSTTDKEEQEIKKPELEGSVADAEEGEVYSESDVPVGRQLNEHTHQVLLSRQFSKLERTKNYNSLKKQLDQWCWNRLHQCV